MGNGRWAMGDGALPIAHSSWRVRQLRRGAGSSTLAPFFRRRRICQNINAVLPAATAASQGQRRGASSLSTRSSWRRVLSVAGSPSKCRSSTTSSNSDGSASAVRFVRLKNRAVFQGMSSQGRSSGCCRGRPSGQIVKPLNVPEAIAVATASRPAPCASQAANVRPPLEAGRLMTA